MRTTEWVAIPLAAAFVLLVAGVSLAIACATVVFRDVEHLVSALLLPLVLPDADPLLAREPARRRGRLRLARRDPPLGNPLTPPVKAIRDPLFFGEWPAAGDVVYLCAAAVVALALGAFVFTRVDDRMAVEL